MKLNSRENNINNNNMHKTVSLQTAFFNDDNRNFTKNKKEILDWNNYESIYKNIISYINLMVIDLYKDKDKLCKYLRDIFYAIFNISQKTKNNRSFINAKEKNKINNDMNYSKKSSLSEEWDFITQDQINKNNNELMEKLLKEELKNENPILTQRAEETKYFNNFNLSPLAIKITKLNKKFKRKENQFKIDKLKYLFRINEQNKLINKLEKEIQFNELNNMTQHDLSKVKCFPDFYIKNKYFNSNKDSNSLYDIKYDEKRQKNINVYKIKHLNSVKNNNDEKLNMNDIFSQNISLLRNEKKLRRQRYSRFISFSFSDTKLKVGKIKNFHS